MRFREEFLMAKSDSDTQSKKILLMGLDNSGKTSIVLSLRRNTNLLSYYSLKPTRGLDIVKFEDHGVNFSIWDFGGQAQYRQEYLQQIDEHTKGIDKFIFVIDVQDTKRYDLALQYLEKIIEVLKKNEEVVDFSVFLHKFDPGLENLDNFDDNALSSKLIPELERIIPPTFSFQVFKTTIFTVFQKRPL